ncbi:MAG: MOSC domain-containing protein [Candidatus Eremiobacteraeota bacterium]|nr:MOSC domain-containing protein [Candidatus Eremiobacteraeota bacterium]
MCNPSSVRLGTLCHIQRYPLKSLRPQPLDRARVELDGLAGDRAGALFVRSGAQRVGKTYRGKENDELHLIADPNGALDAAARRGVEVELRCGERFFDAAPISLLFDRWLDDVSRYVGYAVEWQRFRPNFFVQAAANFNASEDALVDATVAIGSARFTVRAPTRRCAVPTYDPHGRGKDLRVQRFIVNERDNVMGVYCDVASAGEVAVGDAVIFNA